MKRHFEYHQPQCFAILEIITYSLSESESLQFRFGFDKEKITSAIFELGLDENIRGEKLSILQLGELSELLAK